MGCLTEDLGVDRFDPLRFVVGKGGEFVVAAALWNLAAILAQEQEKVLRKPVGHVDDLHDPALSFVLAAQELDLVRKVMFDRPGDAAVKKLRLGRAIEIPVEIGGIVGDLDVAAMRVVRSSGREPMNSGSGSPSGSRSPRNTPSGRSPRLMKRASSMSTPCRRFSSSSESGFLPA